MVDWPLLNGREDDPLTAASVGRWGMMSVWRSSRDDHVFTHESAGLPGTGKKC